MMIRRSSDTQTILRHWREAVPNDRLAHLVKDATKALGSALQARLASYNVSFGHWAFLRILWERDGLTQRELSDHAGVMEPTTFAALKAMERLGYIVRQRVGRDKKKLYVFLTPKGRRLKEQLVPLAETVNKTAIRGATRADVATTRKVLLAIIANLAQDEIARDLPIPSTRVLKQARAGRDQKRKRA